MSRFREDEARFWPYCMIEIRRRKDQAEACGGPTSMPGQPTLAGTDISWEVGAKALLQPPEIKAITRGPPGGAAA